MTCYEYNRKKLDEAEKQEKNQVFDKLTNYFRAVNDDKTDEYHRLRGR